MPEEVENQDNQQSNLQMNGNESQPSKKQESTSGKLANLATNAVIKGAASAALGPVAGGIAAEVLSNKGKNSKQPNIGRETINKTPQMGHTKNTNTDQNNNKQEHSKQNPINSAIASKLPGPAGIAASLLANKKSKEKSSSDSNSDVSSNLISGLTNIGNPMKVMIFLTKVKFILLPLLAVFLIVIAVSSITSIMDHFEPEISASDSYIADSSAEKNSGKYGYEKTGTDEATSDMYKRMVDISATYGKKSSGLQTTVERMVASVYSILSEYDKDFNAEDMTDSMIRKLAKITVKTTTSDDGNETYSYDEELFKSQMNTFFKERGFKEEKSKDMALEVLERIKDFKSLIGEDEDSQSKGNGGAKVVEIALAQLEDSNSSKNGGQKYWSYMGFSSRVAWCACFVSWVANEAGISADVIPRSAAVNTFYEFYTNAGLFHELTSDYTPQPGDLIIWQSGKNAKGWSHIGIVEKYENGKLYTVQGNSSDSVQHVVYDSLNDSGCTGFASPKYPIVGGDTAADIVNGTTITLPAGLGTHGTREFDLAATEAEIAHSRQVMSSSGIITNPYAFPNSSAQRQVQNLWINAGAIHDSSGFCMLNGRYLIAVTTTFGKVGDMVDFHMSGGRVLHCIIGDAKNQGDSGATKWGHSNGANVLEFMGKNSIGNNPYGVLNLNGQSVVKAVNGGSIL